MGEEGPLLEPTFSKAPLPGSALQSCLVSVIGLPLCVSRELTVVVYRGKKDTTYGWDSNKDEHSGVNPASAGASLSCQ